VWIVWYEPGILKQFGPGWPKMIKINQKQFNDGLKQMIYQNLNVALRKAAKLANTELQKLISDLLSSSSTYASLLNGKLKSEFGLQNPEQALQDILKTLQSSVLVEVNPIRISGNVLKGGLSVSMIKEDLSDILALSSVKYSSKTFEVDWLDWLLLQGDRVIIMNAHISYDAHSTKSRSGVAIMEAGGSWRVPPQFSGVDGDNWITKTFGASKIRKRVFDILQSSLERSF
jgi:hypothetical protein